MFELASILRRNRISSSLECESSTFNTDPNSLRGLPSICSAHPQVLRASILFARDNNLPLLIETTCNQVNQDGGYLGMTPIEFMAYLSSALKHNEFPWDRVVTGGDHLGPYPWRNLSAVDAMEKGCEMVSEYVLAGYRKLHLDASMPCADDNEIPLSKKTIAERTALLCASAEITLRQLPETDRSLMYVIGSDVPPPGGTGQLADAHWLTTQDDTAETYDLVHQAFLHLDLEPAWERVIAQVVQPGVDFGNNSILTYDRKRGDHLRQWIETVPDLVFEIHSTDYQPRAKLAELVDDHFAILKVGPALTFAYREAIFNLAAIEDELYSHTTTTQQHSNIRQVLDDTMLRHPEHWGKFYQGTYEETWLMRKYGLSDRSRYYWRYPDIQKALKGLLENLNHHKLPIGLVNQYFPNRFNSTQEDPTPESLVLERIQAVLLDYYWACQSSKIPKRDIHPENDGQ